MNTNILTVIDISLTGLVLLMVAALVVRLHQTAAIRDDFADVHDEIAALALRLRVHERISPCLHCRDHHCEDGDCHHGEDRGE